MTKVEKELQQLGHTMKAPKGFLNRVMMRIEDEKVKKVRKKFLIYSLLTLLILAKVFYFFGIFIIDLLNAETFSVVRMYWDYPATLQTQEGMGALLEAIPWQSGVLIFLLVIALVVFARFMYKSGIQFHQLTSHYV